MLTLLKEIINIKIPQGPGRYKMQHRRYEKGKAARNEKENND